MELCDPDFDPDQFEDDVSLTYDDDNDLQTPILNIDLNTETETPHTEEPPPNGQPHPRC